jgi:hypothetical protein
MTENQTEEMRHNDEIREKLNKAFSSASSEFSSVEDLIVHLNKKMS